MTLFIHSFSKKSESANLVAKDLKAKLIWAGQELPHNQAPKQGDVVINWGSAREAPWMANAKIINDPSAVRVAVSKTWTWNRLRNHNIPTPEYTKDAKKAYQWYEGGSIVYGRKTEGGEQGSGLVVFDRAKRQVGREYFNRFAFFSKRFDTKWEFKIYVAGGRVIRWVYLQPDNRPNRYPHNEMIRNHVNGWFWKSHNQLGGMDKLRADIQQLAVNAVAAVGLDFGAADIGCGERDGEMVVFEVNTAPGGLYGPKAVAKYLKEKVQQ